MVSRSTTQNVTSRSGRPSSSKLRCDSHRDCRPPGPADGVAGAAHVRDARRGHRPNRAATRNRLEARTRPTRHTEPPRRDRGCFPARCQHPLAVRWLRQPHPLRRDPHPAYDGVLALRPRRRAPVEETKTAREVVESVTCRWCGRSDAIELVSRAEADAATRDRRRASRRPGPPDVGGGSSARCRSRRATRVVALAAGRAGQMPADHLPAVAEAGRRPSRRPRRARLAGSQIASVLEADETSASGWRRQVRGRRAGAGRGRCEAGTPPAAADPVELRRGRLPAASRRAGRRWSRGRPVPRDAERARPPAGRSRSRSSGCAASSTTPTEELRETRERGTGSRSPSSRPRTPSCGTSCGDARARLRGRGAGRRDAWQAAGRPRRPRRRPRPRRPPRPRPAGCGPGSTSSRREVAAARRARAGRAGRAGRCARGCCSTPCSTPRRGCAASSRCRRSTGSPADPVEADVAQQGGRTPTGHGSLAVDDPALLDAAAARCRGRTWSSTATTSPRPPGPSSPLEKQRDRLLGGLRAAGGPDRGRGDRRLRRGRQDGAAAGEPAAGRAGPVQPARRDRRRRDPASWSRPSRRAARWSWCPATRRSCAT